MKKLWWIAGLTLLGAGLFAGGLFFQDLSLLFRPPRVLARVNGVEISEVDLKRELFLLRGNNTMPLSNLNREDVLDRLVNDVLILEEAKRLGLTVPEPQVLERLTAAREGYTPDEVSRSLKETRLTPAAWRELVRKQLLIEATVQKLVESQVHVGQEEIDSYYWSHLTEFYRPPRVHARQIVVETEAQAQELKRRLEAGEDFKSLAAKYSRGPEKDAGGDLGWVGQADLPRTFSQALFRLRPGEVSAPVATEYGYHLFKAEEFQPGGKLDPEEAKRKVAEELKLEKVDRAFATWLEDLRGKAKITLYDLRGDE
jgi:parvulin-like peptidyl-prolyl isomerase